MMIITWMSILGCSKKTSRGTWERAFRSTSSDPKTGTSQWISMRMQGSLDSLPSRASSAWSYKSVQTRVRRLSLGHRQKSSCLASFWFSQTTSTKTFTLVWFEKVIGKRWTSSKKNMGRWVYSLRSLLTRVKQIVWLSLMSYAHATLWL